MKKLTSIILIGLLATSVTLTGCSSVPAESQPTTVKATEKVTEKATEKVTEVPTTQKETEKPTEPPTELTDTMLLLYDDSNFSIYYEKIKKISAPVLMSIFG